MRITRRKKIIIAGVAVMALAGGSALAYWTQDGSGSGSASAGQPQCRISVQQDNPTVGLFPGGPSMPLTGRFQSPSTMPLHASSLTAVVRPFSSQVETGKPACTQADFVIVGNSGPFTIAADTGPGGSGTPTTWSGLSVRLVENGLNQDNCKTVLVDIDYTLNA
jgi:hypothetical protein